MSELLAVVTGIKLMLTQLTTLKCIDQPYPIMESIPAPTKCQILRNLAFSIGKLTKSQPDLVSISMLFFRAITR